MLPFALFGRRTRGRTRLPVGYNHFDGILDTLAGIAQRSRQVSQRKRVGVDFRRIETLFRHQRHRAVGGAASFAPTSIGIDIVLHEMRDIDRDRIVRKRGEADFSAAVGNVNGLIDRGFGSGALDHVVGADRVININDEDAVEVVKQLTGGIGADYVESLFR